MEAPRLIVIFSPFRQLYGPLMQVVTDLQKAHPGRDIAVIVPSWSRPGGITTCCTTRRPPSSRPTSSSAACDGSIVVNVPWYLAD